MQDRKDMREKNIQPKIYGDVKIESNICKLPREVLRSNDFITTYYFPE
jgi:hypothetical protein